MSQEQENAEYRQSTNKPMAAPQSERREISWKLDRLYNKNIRCPYCKTPIKKYVSVCEKCGITKEQIASASSRQAKAVIKQKSGEKLFMTRQRPDDLSLGKMAAWLILGMFGAHNFYAGRKLRGWIALGCFLVGFICLMCIPLGTASKSFDDMHHWREPFMNIGIPFPTDVFILVSVVMWVYDAFGVVFGYYKYPVRLGRVEKSK